MDVLDLINVLDKAPELKPAIITSTVALIAAILALFGGITFQIIAHRYAMKRENEKYSREVYQKLFSPILSQVDVFFNVNTSFRKESYVKRNVDPSELRNKIVEHIGSNLMYAKPSLISAYKKVQMNSFFDDMSGFNHKIDDLELILTFLDNLYLLNKKERIFGYHVNKDILKYRVLYLLWIISAGYENNIASSARMVGLNFYLEETIYTNKTFKKIRTKYLKRLRRSATTTYCYYCPIMSVI